MKCENCDAQSLNSNFFMECANCGCEICEDCSLEYGDDEYCFDCQPQSSEYPEGFFHFGGGGAIEISDETIREWLDAARKKLKNSAIGEYSYTASGDTIVFAHKYEDEYVFRVCKNYYELSVNPEDIDNVEF